MDTTGDAANIILDKVIGVWCTGTNWAIYNEDISAMDENLEFNVYIAPEVLAIGDVETAEVFMLPNPTKGLVTNSANEEIQNLTLYNILGQKVQELNANNLHADLDLSNLPTGQYIVEINTLNASETKKLIKN